MADKPQMVKIATIWEVVEGEMEGKYLIEPRTEDDLPEVFCKINMASVHALKALLDSLRTGGANDEEAPPE